MSAGGEAVPELACYYGGKGWIGSSRLIDWTKSLLLFFDGIAAQFPPDEFDSLVDSDPVLAQPLVERGLLVNYARREQGSDIEVIFDPATGEIWSKLGEVISPIPAALLERSKEDSIRPLSVFKSVYSALRADELRRTTASAGIQPVTDNEIIAQIVASSVKAYANASKARVIVADLKTVGLDFSAVSLDEVLDYRSQHGSEYRSYARDLRSFTLDLSLMSADQQALAMKQRAREFEDRAEDLRRLTRKAYKRSAIALAFGIAGAAWTLSMGDPWGAVFAGGASIAASGVQDPLPIGSTYSYILRASDELHR